MSSRSPCVHDPPSSPRRPARSTNLPTTLEEALRVILKVARDHDVDPDAQGIVSFMGALAASAVSEAREREGLSEALHSRKVIGQAIGIVMERFEINEDRAFAFLVRASSSGDMKLRDIAQELVDTGNCKSDGG